MKHYLSLQFGLMVLFMAGVIFPGSSANAAVLSLNKPVTCTTQLTSTVPQHLCAHAVDGDLNTYWETTSFQPDSITIDLGSGNPYAISGMTFRPGPTNTSISFSVSTSSDGITYTVRDNFNSAGVGIDITRAYAPLLANVRYVRILQTTTPASNNVAFYEISVLGALEGKFNQLNWSAGVPADATACTAVGGTWTGAQCEATNAANQSGWRASSSLTSGLFTAGTSGTMPANTAERTTVDNGNGTWTTTLQPSAAPGINDAYTCNMQLSGEFSNTNYGSSTDLRVGTVLVSSSLRHCRTFLNFDGVSALPINQVVSMNLVLTATAAGGPTILVSTVNSSWSEGTITYDTQPAVTSTTTTVGPVAAAGTYTIPLPLSAWPLNGIQLKNNNEAVATSRSYFQSSESATASARPKLVITYNTDPVKIQAATISTTLSQTSDDGAGDSVNAGGFNAGTTTGGVTVLGDGSAAQLAVPAPATISARSGFGDGHNGVTSTSWPLLKNLGDGSDGINTTTWPNLYQAGDGSDGALILSATGSTTTVFSDDFQDNTLAPWANAAGSGLIDSGSGDYVLSVTRSNPSGVASVALGSTIADTWQVTMSSDITLGQCNGVSSATYYQIYGNASNGYSMGLDYCAQSLIIYRMTGGVQTVLALQGMTVTLGQWYTVRLKLDQGQLTGKAYLGKNIDIDTTLNAPLATVTTFDSSYSSFTTLSAVYQGVGINCGCTGTFYTDNVTVATIPSGSFNLAQLSSDALGNADDDNPGQPDGFTTALTSDALTGATSLTVDKTIGFEEGDQVMILQTQHAFEVGRDFGGPVSAADYCGWCGPGMTSKSGTYEFRDAGNAGKYEFATVTSTAFNLNANWPFTNASDYKVNGTPDGAGLSGLTSGLVGLWHMTGTVGPIASGDLIPDSQNNVTVNNGTVLGAGMSYAPGVYGQGISFFGPGGGYITTGANGRPSNNFTFEAWVKTSTTTTIVAESTTGVTGGGPYVFGPRQIPTYSIANNFAGAGVSVGTNGIKVVEYGSTVSGHVPSLAVYSASIGTGWNHVAVVFNNKTPSIYLNGVLVHTGLTSTRDYVYAPIDIGGGPFGSTNTLNGTIDEAAVYDTVLSAGTILAHYQDGAAALASSGDPSLIEVTGGVARLVSPYSTSNPTIVNNTGVPYQKLLSFTETLGGATTGAVRYQISNNGVNWYYHNGATWVSGVLNYAQTNTAAQVNTNITTFHQAVGTGNFFYRAYLNSNGSQPVEIDQIAVTYRSPTGTTLTISGDGPGGGLINNYYATGFGKAQVIRVPQYTSVTINAGVTLTTGNYHTQGASSDGALNIGVSGSQSTSEEAWANGAGAAAKLGGQALSLDGTSDTVGLPAFASTFGTDNGVVSLSIWVYIEPGETDGSVICTSGSTARTWLGLSSGRFYSQVWGQQPASSATNLTITDPSVASTGAWHHVAVTFDKGGNWKLYVDDSLRVATTLGTRFNTGAPSVGCTFYDGLQARVDELGIYNTALSAAEIGSLYNGGTGREIAKGETGVVSVYHFNEGAGSIIADSGSVVTGTGGVLVFRANGAVTINGTIDMNGKGYAGGVIGGAAAKWSHQGETYTGYRQMNYRDMKVLGTVANFGGGGYSWYRETFGDLLPGGASGGGGHGTAGQDGAGAFAPAKGGSAYGSPNLTTILPGSGGGGPGGNGGGIIFITGNTVTLGVAGVVRADGTSTGSGGAGGSIYLGAAGAVTAGSNQVTASGGVGVASYGSGGVGRIYIEGTLSGTTAPVAVTGSGAKINGYPTGVINKYASLGATDVAKNATLITVATSEVSGFATGDEIMIIQMQHPNNAGRYEFRNNITVTNNGATTTISFVGGLLHNYYGSASGGRAQIVRVPNYTNFVVGGGTAITTPDYNPATGKGGIIAFRANGTVTVDGKIDTFGRGFPGGQIYLDSHNDMHVTQGWSYNGVTPVESFLNNAGGGGVRTNNLLSVAPAPGTFGGGGSYATAGMSPNTADKDASAGVTYGEPDLSLLMLGSGGGGTMTGPAGGQNGNVGGYRPGIGGYGGGAVFMTANTVTVNDAGVITAKGGVADSTYTTPYSTVEFNINTGRQGGAGSGGSVYLGANTLNINTQRVDAGGGESIAGLSGPGISGVVRVDTVTGGNGRIYIEGALTGTATPTATTGSNARLFAWPNGVINKYASLGTTNYSPGATSITIAASEAAGFANSDEILIIQMSHATNAGIYEFKRLNSSGGVSTSGSTTTLNFSGSGGLINNYYGSSGRAQVVLVPNYTNLVVADGEGLGLVAAPYNATTGLGGIIAFRANGTVTIRGPIDAAGKGFAGGQEQSAASGYQGTGSTGATPQQNPAPVVGAGGGGVHGNFAEQQGAGGGGGHATAGSNGQGWNDSAIGGSHDNKGLGGGIYGDAVLASMLLGSGGGAGSGYDNAFTLVNGPKTPGAGGAGGGLIFMTANTIALAPTGSVNAKGNAGGHPTASNTELGGGGGGAGGSIFVAANSISQWAGAISAIGGIGGGFTTTKLDTSANAWLGGDGGKGRVRVEVPGGSTTLPNISGAGVVSIADAVSPTSGIFTSTSIFAGASTDYGVISWTPSSLPAGKSATVFVRASNSPTFADFESSSTLVIGASGTQTTTTQAWNNAAAANAKIGGQALSLDGTDDYVNVPDDNALDPTAITIEAWMYRQGIAGNIVSKGISNMGYRIQIAGDRVNWTTNSRGTRDGTAASLNILQSSLTTALNGWSHVVVTGDSTGHKIYINGVLDPSPTQVYGTSATPFNVANNADPLIIGGNLQFNEYHYGRLDEMVVYNRALTLAEITARYNTGNGREFTGFENGFITGWHFNEGSGSSATRMAGGWTQVTNGQNLGTLFDGKSYLQYAVSLDASGGSATQGVSFDGLSLAYNRLDYPVGSYTIVSTPFNTQDFSNKITAFTWAASTPESTGIKFQLRTSPDGMAWSPWYGTPVLGITNGLGTYFTALGQAIPPAIQDNLSDQYFQYRAILENTLPTITPTLSNVTVNYAPGRPTMIVEATTPSAFENGSSGVFTFTKQGTLADAMTVYYTVSGTATGGADYTALSGSVSFAATDTSRTINIVPVNDTLGEGDEAVTVTLSTSTGYFIGEPSSATVNIVDDEAAGINVTPVSGLVTTESGGTAQFTVVLASQPPANVAIGLSTSDTTEGAPSPSSLTFTGANWNIPQTVTVTGVDDSSADGNIAYTIVTAPAVSIGGGAYHGLDAADVAVVTPDNDSASITVTPVTGLYTTEAGGQAAFNVAINGTPTGNVVINLSSSDTTEGNVSTPSVTFTPANAVIPQTVTVTGQSDALSDGNMNYSIVTAAATSTDPAYSNFNAPDVSLVNLDGNPGISVIADQTTATSWPFTNVKDYTLSDASQAEVSAGSARLKLTAPASALVQTSNDGSADTPNAGGFNAGTLPASVKVTGSGTGASVVKTITAGPSTTTVSAAVGVAGTLTTSTTGLQTSVNQAWENATGSHAKLGGQALSFDGTNDYVSVTNSALNITGAGSMLTLEAWFKTHTMTPVWQTILFKGTSNTSSCATTNCPERQYALFLNNTGYIGFASTAAGATAQTWVTTPAGIITAGQWFHVAGVIDSVAGTIKIYVNGTEQVSGAYSTAGIRSATGNLYMGRDTTGGPNLLNGVIDEVMIYNQALSAAQITARYNGGNGLEFTGSEAGLVSGWHTNDGAPTSQPFVSAVMDMGSANVNVGTVNWTPITQTGGAGLTVEMRKGLTVSPSSGLNPGVLAVGTLGQTTATAAWNAAIRTPVDGQGLHFDGLDDRVTMGAVNRPANNFTVEGWVKVTSGTITSITTPSTTTTQGTSGQRYLLDPEFRGGTADDNNSGMGVSLGTNGLYVFEHAGSYLPPLAVYNATFTAGLWYHIAIVYNNKIPYIYRNGALVATGLQSPKTNVYAPRTIGGQTYGWFNGAVDQVAVWNRPLTAAEIASHYFNQGSTTLLYQNPKLKGNESGLIGLWHFNEGTGATIADTSANPNWTDWMPLENGADTLAALNGQRYLQYRAVMTSSTTNAAQFDSISINANTAGSYPTAGPTVVNKSGVPYSQLVSFAETYGANNTGSVKYQLSNNGTSWYYHDGSSWVAASSAAQSNTGGEVTARIGSFASDVGAGTFYFKAFLNSTGTEVVELDKVTVGYVGTNVTTSEAGQTGNFKVVLNTVPTGDVTVGLVSADTTEGMVSVDSVTFTTANWSTAQTVTVNPVNDSVDDGNITYNIITSAASSTDGTYNGMGATDVMVTNLDDDVAGITVSPSSGLQTSEAGGTASFNIVLDSQPTSSVSIGLSSSNTAEGTVPPSVTFTGANWNTPQAVTVTGINDALVDGNVAYNIVTAAATSSDSLYNGVNSDDVAVTNVDNDSTTVGTVIITPLDGTTTEGGGTATFNVVLNVAPTANVSVALFSSDTTEGMVSATSLTFTVSNWSMPQLVTVTGVDDTLYDGNVAYTIVTQRAVSTDAKFSDINPADMSVVNQDNDFSLTASSGQIITVSAEDAGASEGSADTGAFTITRAGRTANDLVVNYSVSGTATAGTDYVALNGSVVIPEGSSSVTVNVVTIDDTTFEGDETTELKITEGSGYVISAPSSASVVIYDNETPPPAVNIGLNQTVEEGATVKVNVYLGDSAPEYPVEIPYTVSGTATSGADHNAATAGTMVITSGTKGGIAFTVNKDSSAEADETVVITLGTPGSGARLGQRTSQTVTITEDNVAPSVNLSAKQSGNQTRLIVKVPELVTITAAVTDANSADTHGYSWSASSALVRENSADNAFVFNPASVAAGTYTVTVTVTDGEATTTTDLSLQVIDSAPALGSTDSDGDGVNDNLEGFGDTDNDGIPNYQDASILNSAELQGEAMNSDSNVLNANPELNLTLGNTAFGTDGDAAISAGQLPSDSVSNVGGYFDMTVTGLPQAGQSIDIVIPQTAVIPANAVYRKYTATGWTDFVEDDHNTIASAAGSAGICPAANDPAYTPGLIAGSHCVQLTIQDGGSNDADGAANYQVKDPGGVGSRAVTITISKAATGGGAINLMALMAMLLLLGMRIFRQSSK